MSHVTNCTNGGRTEESRTFLITSTVNGGLYQVSLCEAGSWMVLQTAITIDAIIADNIFNNFFTFREFLMKNKLFFVVF